MMNEEEVNALPVSIKLIRAMSLFVRHWFTKCFLLYWTKEANNRWLGMFHLIQDFNFEHMEEEGPLEFPDTLAFVYKFLDIVAISPLVRDMSHYTLKKKLLYLCIVTFPTLFVVTASYIQQALKYILFVIIIGTLKYITPTPIWRALVRMTYLYFCVVGYFMWCVLMANAVVTLVVRVTTSCCVVAFKYIQYHFISRGFGKREEEGFAKLEFDILLVGFNIFGLEDMYPQEPPNSRRRQAQRQEEEEQQEQHAHEQ